MNKRPAFDQENALEERVIIRQPPPFGSVVPKSQGELLKLKLSRNGLTFKFLAVELKLVRHILENNDFLDFNEESLSLDHTYAPLVMWSS